MLKKILFLFCFPIIVFSQDGSEVQNSLAQGVEYYKQYMPTSTCGEIIDYEFYSVSYCSEIKLSEWTIYYSTKYRFINRDLFPRSNNFSKDKKNRGADLNDFKFSGYDRGHLVPASDMSFDENAMEESFYFTNISPQTAAFNRGGWRLLEKKVRDWTFQFDPVTIITGQFGGKDTIGENNIPVPEYFYKIFFEIKSNRAIAFLIPNGKVNGKLLDYVVSINLLETLTGIDFFHKLEDDIEFELENLNSAGDVAYGAVIEEILKVNSNR